MIDNDDRPAPPPRTGTDGRGGNESAEVQIAATVRLLARLLGRQMAREAYAQLSADNDNRRPETATD